MINSCKGGLEAMLANLSLVLEEVAWLAKQARVFEANAYLRHDEWCL